MARPASIRSILGAAIAFAAAAACAADQAHLSAAPFEDRRPRIHASALSLYGTASDYRHRLDFQATLEWPLSERVSVLGGLRRQRLVPDGMDDFERTAWGIEAALRRHPWDWMPGFFLQALAAMERSVAVNPSHEAGPLGYGSHSPFYDSHVARAERSAYEGGLGYGYVWTFGRLSLEMQGVLGPLMWSETTFASWLESRGRLQSGKETSHGWESILRFRDIRVGLRF